MRKKKEDLAKQDDYTAEKIVFQLNDWISNFGQSYIRPSIILLVSMLLFYFIRQPYAVDLVMHTPYIGKIMQFMNGVFEQVPILSHLLDASSCDNLTFIRMLFYIWYSVLIWQIIVAVKRHVRR